MTDDIVARLRDIEGGYGFRGICREAAAEIERLREELTASHESHGNEVGSLTERLSLAIHERDEARRRVCEDAIRNGRVYRRVGSDTVRCETSKEVAEMMGWDCYKENKENTND